jgi:hypothetical protein
MANPNVLRSMLEQLESTGHLVHVNVPSIAPPAPEPPRWADDARFAAVVKAWQEAKEAAKRAAALAEELRAELESRPEGGAICTSEGDVFIVPTLKHFKAVAAKAAVPAFERIDQILTFRPAR